MKVKDYKNEDCSCFVGDVVLYKKMPCMVIKTPDFTKRYALVCLEGVDAGEVVYTTVNYMELDVECTKVLIKNQDVEIRPAKNSAVEVYVEGLGFVEREVSDKCPF